MNHWQESAELLARLAELAAAGERAALATVVRVVGSAYRRPGAKLLVSARDEALGGVSGGCLEADVREIARGVLAGGPSRLLAYDTSAGDVEVFGLGMGCRGRVEVFVQAATEGPVAALVPRWRAALQGDEPFAVATVVGGGGELGAMSLAGAERSAAPGAPGGRTGAINPLASTAAAALAEGLTGCLEIGGRLVFVESLQPPPHLLVCGAGDDAVPLVALAADAGFRVTVADHRAALLTAARFPDAHRRLLGRGEHGSLELPPPTRTRAVVMTHSFGHDREWVRRLLASGVASVGLLGPRDRTAEIRRELGADDDPRLFGPIGLDLGADGPRQVALSIVAELLVQVNARSAQRLSERAEAIHAR